MGHWSEQLLDEVAARTGPNADTDELKAILKTVGTEIELLTGRVFGDAQQRTENFEPGGLPFVEVPDGRIGSFEGGTGAWPIPDPVHPEMATVLQLWQPTPVHPSDRALPTGQALLMAGHLVGEASRAGLFSPEPILWWIANNFDNQQRVELLKWVLEPTNRFYVPILAGSQGGWWFQVTRRVRWMTGPSDDQRLVQTLIDQDRGMRALVGLEPVLIMARLTSHPVQWAFTARIWPDVVRPATRSWPQLAPAIHGYGIPILTIDRESSAEELACQLVLLAFWHQYIGPEETGLADAVAGAYPTAVEWIRRATNAPDRGSAASMLLAELLRPGFDPARGAKSSRWYVNRKASIAVLKHRKIEATGERAWESLGVTERSYYKLLKRFAPKVGGRYEIDEGVHDRIRAYLGQRAQATGQRQAAMQLLQDRGFTWEAARKWLQRHPIEEIRSARPRTRRGAGDA